jgi:TonB-dependent receptor
MKYIFTFFIGLASLAATAQNGTIRGTVIDDVSGETIIGASVLVVNKPGTGAVTDLDGAFSIDIAPGTYELKISYIGMQTLTISGIVVESKKVDLLQNIRLKESSVELEEVVITATAVRATESALMTLKMKSPAMMDGISADRIKSMGDNNAVDAAKRITGVSIEGGKYVYIRGLGDRYTKTILNSMEIPGLDPDRNALQVDIFPTALIDNIIVSKTFSAEMPADFTGGLMNIETKAFPEQRIFDVSFGISYNPAMHFNANNLTYDLGKTDFLGFDDGSRALPDRARQGNIPTPISGASGPEVFDFVTSFNPQLGAKKQRSLADYNFSLSYGDQKDLKSGKQLGYIFSLSYRQDQLFYDDVTYGEFQRWQDPTINEMRVANMQTGQMGERNTLVGLLGGIALKSNLNKYRFTVMHLQNGESRAGQFDIVNDDEAVGQSGYYAYSDNLEYNQKGMTNVLISGAHVLNTSGWEVDWRVSPTLSNASDPDIRKTAWTATEVDTFFNAGNGGNPARIWRDLSEINANARVDVTKHHKAFNRDAKFRTGTSYTYKMRDYEILFYDVQFFGGQVWPNPVADEVLKPENIYGYSGVNQNNIYYQSGNPNPNPNAYSSNVNLIAFYASEELNPTLRLKAVIGLRGEYFVQRHTGRDQRYASGDTINGRNLNNEEVLNSFDLFPSINLVYQIKSTQNLRFSYARTIARPSFKELSFAQIIDPITNRIFNGSLFTYGDWDGNLVSTNVDDIDVRWETFMPRNQTFSVSVFYKRFQNPIEMVRIPEQQTSQEFQARNVGNGSLIGLEFEFRKTLEFISPSLTNFSLNGNLTLVRSVIDMTVTEYNARKYFEREGETIKNTRQMAGQAPYLVNAGIGYNHPESALDVLLFYNVKGPTLTIVGVGLYPDVFQDPFHSLNFSISKKLGKEKNTSINLRVQNILNDNTDYYFQSFEAPREVFSRLYPGIAFSVGVGIKL